MTQLVPERYETAPPLATRAAAQAYCPACQDTMPGPNERRCPACGAARPDAGWPRDDRLGCAVVGDQYRVLRRLGSGGFGTVYLVETVVGGLRRALKVLHPEWAGDRRMRERFVNEALVLEQVNHPNVARCYAVGMLEEDKEPYLLLELVDGVSLNRVMEDATGTPRPLSPARAANLAKQIASGLVVAHANQVLHRDLKPENILVVGAGTPSEQVKIVDFGIAKSLAADAQSTQAVLGTPRYMAPEQLEPGIALDRRADLWQLGALLFLMLTGRPPYEIEGGIVQLVARHRERLELGPPLASVDPSLANHPLDRLTRQLLATDRDHRPGSASKVCEELARLEHALTPGAVQETSVALLEALCANPSRAGWWAVCRYLSEPRPERACLVDAADALLADWPDEFRVAPTGWWDEVRCGQEHPLWSLARTLDLSGRSVTDEVLREIVATPALATITRLSLADNVIGNAGVATLAASPHLGQLRFLDLSSNRISSEGVVSLAGSSQLHDLRTISLASNGIGPRGAEAIAGATLSLRELDLSDNEITATGAHALAEGEAMGALEVLVLRSNALGSDGAGVLAVSPRLDSLRVLDLGHNAIGPSGAAALALSPNLRRLRSLSLAQNRLGLQGVELLLASSRFEGLEALDLSSNEIGAQGAMLLAAAPFARRLKRLDLRDNHLSDAGLAALLGAPHLTGLRRLDVGQNEISAAGATLLGGAPPELEALDLSANPLGPTGGSALSQALRRMRISRLAVSGCELGTDGLAAIVEGGGGRLVELAGSGNAVGAEGAERLGAMACASTLQVLDLSRNGLGLDGLTALARSPHLGTLRRLHLGSNDLRDADGEAMVVALANLSDLDSLDLSDNGLGVTAAVALARSTLTGRLCDLNLAFNTLGDAGGSALTQGHSWQVLHRLDLEGNDIGLGATATLLAAPTMRYLSRVNLARNALTGLIDVHSLAQRQVALLESSFATLAARQADFAERFYQALFARYPNVKPLFASTPMKRQQQHLLSALAMVIDNLRNPDAVQRGLGELGARHIGYGVSPSHYHAMSSILLETIRQALEPDWTDDLDDAWRDAIEAVCRGMLHGSDTAHTPAPATARPEAPPARCPFSAASTR